MPRPIALESPLSQGWCLLSEVAVTTVATGRGFLGFLSVKKGFPMEEKGLVSRIEVGLMAASECEEPFAEKPTKRLGEAKREEEEAVGLLGLPVGVGREGGSDIRPCLLLTALDLLPNIVSLLPSSLVSLKARWFSFGIPFLDYCLHYKPTVSIDKKSILATNPQRSSS